jgi:hypothetical protein
MTLSKTPSLLMSKRPVELTQKRAPVETLSLIWTLKLMLTVLLLGLIDPPTRTSAGVTAHTPADVAQLPGMATSYGGIGAVNSKPCVEALPLVTCALTVRTVPFETQTDGSAIDDCTWLTASGKARIAVAPQLSVAVTVMV